jgi:putative Mn2+ efflux pump MntP
MNNGKLVIGAVLLLVGLWMFFTLDNMAARWIGGGIIIILGVAQLMAGYKGGEKAGQVQPQQKTEQPENT